VKNSGAIKLRIPKQARGEELTPPLVTSLRNFIACAAIYFPEKQGRQHGPQETYGKSGPRKRKVIKNSHKHEELMKNDLKIS
jgi:hypothetical protein